MAKQGIFQENEEKNADFYVIKHISHKHFVSLQRYKRENNKRCSTAFRNAESKKRRRL